MTRPPPASVAGSQATGPTSGAGSDRGGTEAAAQAPAATPAPRAQPSSPSWEATSHVQEASASTHTVRAGETLWSIARTHLAAQTGTVPSSGAVALAAQHLHAENLELLGSDPDLILPGQRLAVASLTSAALEAVR